MPLGFDRALGSSASPITNAALAVVPSSPHMIDHFSLLTPGTWWRPRNGGRGVYVSNGRVGQGEEMMV